MTTVDERPLRALRRTPMQRSRMPITPVRTSGLLVELCEFLISFFFQLLVADFVFLVPHEHHYETLQPDDEVPFVTECDWEKVA